MYGGSHFVINALSAICVGLKNNIEMEKIIQGIEEFELTKNRMEIIEKQNGIKIINDCYNANYDSMKAAITYLGNMKENRKIAILGDMFELGEFSKDLHEKVGEEVYKNKIDILITVGENSKNICKQVISLGMSGGNVFSYDKNAEAIQKIKEIVRENDSILIKASHSMNFKEIVDALK